MIRVASYNIHKAVGTDRKRDPGRVCRALGALKADVVTLQEADMRFGSRQSVLPEAQVREAGYDIVPFHIRPGGIGWHGNALLVRRTMKVESGEAEADANAEVAGELAEVERQVRRLEKTGEVEDELAALKQRLTLEKAERQ